MRHYPHHVVALLLLLASVHGEAAKNYGLNLDGQPVHQLSVSGTRIVVLVFAASDCPISTRYIPEDGYLLD